MSGATGGTKAVFPLSLPLAGQTLLFPGPPNSSVARCDSHCRGRLPPLDSAKNRCSCESLHGHPSPPTVNSHSRILLPVSPPNQTVPSSFGSFSGTTLSDPWLRIASAASRSSYEPVILSGFPLYGKLSADNYPSLDYALLANARRKNATRETTSTLKAWLNEHRKNPYPTKGEKIMLAILTKMTLTQVSTWFANARRRLKKENKMTWSPRKKTGERKLASGATKSDNISECDSDADDDEDDDDESMDIHVEVEDKAELPTPVSGGRQNVDSLSVDSRQSASRAVNLEPAAVTRPSVIRVMESPTFDEIKNRFKNDCSPVNNLQKWVNGCFVGAELSDYPRDLTPPNTPLDDRVSPSASQKIFDAFCLKFDHRVAAGKAADVAAVEAQGPAVPVMTPQPSPRAGDTVSAVLVRYGTENSNDQPSKDASRGIPSQNEVRTQGLTTSREFEAVLALTALSKT